MRDKLDRRRKAAKDRIGNHTNVNVGKRLAIRLDEYIASALPRYARVNRSGLIRGVMSDWLDAQGAHDREDPPEPVELQFEFSVRLVRTSKAGADGSVKQDVIGVSRYVDRVAIADNPELYGSKDAMQWGLEKFLSDITDPEVIDDISSKLVTGYQSDRRTA